MENTNDRSYRRDQVALAGCAAAKLANFSGDDIVRELIHLSPGFAQDVLEALPTDARERAISAAPPDVAFQWQRNALYDPGTIGRMMEPVVAAFPPDMKVGETVEELRELVTRALITYSTWSTTSTVSSAS